MSEYIFPDFLADPSQYEAAEAQWRHGWDGLIRRLGKEGSWESPWHENTFGDGTPCRDGNPIFSAFSHAERRALRVIQQEPMSDPDELTFWTDTFARGEPEELAELVISCVLTERTFQKALGLIQQWVLQEELDLSRCENFPINT